MKRHSNLNRYVGSAGTTIGIVVDPPDALLCQAADQLAIDLDSPVVDLANRSYDLLLAVTPYRLELRQSAQCESRQSRPIFVDLDQLDTTSPAGRCGRQPIAKAVGIKKVLGRAPLVADATAGFGADAWLLASLGCQVIAFERCPIVAALLRDGLARASRTDPAVASRIRLVTADSRQVLSGINPRPDVVYLDTMFPPKRKRGLERKPLRILRQIVGADTDAAVLFDVALRTAASRVVVKRPLYAEPLGEGDATVSHRGKSLRYDVYVVGGRIRTEE